MRSMSKRERDPSQVSVQINTRIPFWLREILADAALARQMSQADILRKALENELRPEIVGAQRQARQGERIETYTVDA